MSYVKGVSSFALMFMVSQDLVSFLCFLQSDKSKIKEILSTVLKILMCLFALLSL